MMIALIFPFLISLSFAEVAYKDSSLKSKDAPAFLKEAVPKSGDIDDVEYFVKKYSDGKVTYELKYEENDEEVSVSYSSDGKFLEKEEDKRFSSVDSTLRSKIESHLKSKYGKYQIHETEIRTTQDGKRLIDLEVSHGKNTGLTELSYTMEGVFVSEEEEKMPQIETLN